MSETENKKLSDLIPDRNNANKGTERGRYALEKSLERLGAGRSILIDKKGRIIAGNKTAEVSGEIGLDDVIVVKTDGKKLVAVQRVDLDLEKDALAKELAIADNRVQELDLEWDVEQLQAYLGDEVAVDLYFKEEEIERLLKEVEGVVEQTTENLPPEDFKEYSENIETEHSCPKCGYKWSGKSNAGD